MARKEIYEQLIRTKLNDIYEICIKHNIPCLAMFSLHEENDDYSNYAGIANIGGGKMSSTGLNLFIAAALLVPGMLDKYPQLIFLIPPAIEAILQGTEINREEIDAAAKRLLGEDKNA